MDERGLADGGSESPARVIAMSDVVGSSRVGVLLGDRAYYELVMEHHRLVRGALATYRGVEFSEGGDSLLAWFADPQRALECAITIQRRAATNRRRGSRLAIKIGLAGGRPFFGQGRPYGSVVNRAARLTAQACEHQIVVDATALSWLQPSGGRFTITTAELRNIGRHTVGIWSGDDCELDPVGLRTSHARADNRSGWDARPEADVAVGRRRRHR